MLAQAEIETFPARHAHEKSPYGAFFMRMSPIFHYLGNKFINFATRQLSNIDIPRRQGIAFNEISARFDKLAH